MSKQLIAKVLIASKEIISIDLSKKRDRPENLSAVVFMGIKLSQENLQKCEFGEGDVFSVTVALTVKMFDQELLSAEKQNIDSLFENDEDSCFICRAEIMANLKFRQAAKYQEPLLPQFSEEIVSLAYDDIRTIIEDCINRTSYRGFYFPDDFREIAKSQNELFAASSKKRHKKPGSK